MRLEVVVQLTVATAKIIADKANTELAALLLPLVASRNSCKIEPRGCPDIATSPVNKFGSPAQKVTKIVITTNEHELMVVERSNDFGISVPGFSVSSAAPSC